MSTMYLVLNFFFMQNLLLVYGLGFGPAQRSGVVFRFQPARFLVNALLMLVGVALAWGLHQIFVIILGLTYLRTMLFVIVLVGLVAGSRALAGRRPDHHQSNFMRVIFPVNLLSAAMGLMVLCTEPGYGFGEAMLAALGGVLGYGAAFFLYGEVLGRMDLEWVPRSMRGLPLALISLGLVSLVFLSVSALLLPGMR